MDVTDFVSVACGGRGEGVGGGAVRLGIERICAWDDCARFERNFLQTMSRVVGRNWLRTDFRRMNLSREGIDLATNYNAR